MKKIVVIGGGFAGNAACKSLTLGLAEAEAEIFLIDKNSYTTMLPSLPDLVGSRVTRNSMTREFSDMLPKRIKFINENVTTVSLPEKKIKTDKGTYEYDYLIFAPGSVTNFFDFNQSMDRVRKMDCLDDAENIRSVFIDELDAGKFRRIVISGAGFTGMELACNLRHILKSRGKSMDIVMVERAKRILPMVSEKLADYVEKNMNTLGINIMKDHFITEFDGKDVVLNTGEKLEDVFFCWCSGVKVPFKPEGEYKTLPDGRVQVDDFLRVTGYPEAYVAGDCAGIKQGEMYLRRAVNFASMSGKQAAENIVRSIKGLPLQKAKILDLGWVIPLYITSIGVAFGHEIKGRKGVSMHYLMCGLKNYSLSNFISYGLYAFKFFWTSK